MFKTIMIILLLPSLSLAQLIDSDVMPFGGYSSHGATSTIFFTPEKLEIMHDSLGINQFTTGDFYATTAGLFASKGIFVYPFGGYAGGSIVEPQQQYAHSTFVISHPDSNHIYNIGFYYAAGWNGGPGNEYRCFADSGVMLKHWWLRLDNKSSALNDDHLKYYPYLKVGKDTTTLDPETPVAYFTAERVYKDSTGDDQFEMRFIDTLFAGDLPVVPNDTLISLKHDSTLSNFFNIVDDPLNDSSYFAQIQLHTLGACTVFVDYFQMHCQYGGDLMGDNADPEIADDIIASTGRTGYKDKILGWMLRDTIYPRHYRPNAYIDGLIQQAMIDSGWTNNPVRGYPWFNSASRGYGDYARLAQPDVFWAYLYPIDISTSKTGWYQYYPDSIGNKLQSNIQSIIAEPCSTIREIIGDGSMTWMYCPQYWFCITDSGCTNWEQRRKPTESELKCMTFLGLCYKPKGIMFWKYDSSPDGEYGFQGLVDTSGTPRPEMYGVVKEHINPYIKAIDATYLPLEWQRAYAYHNGTPDFDPPSGAYVSSISSYTHPDSVSLNPDSGWFHVGEYTEGSDKYIMLVNRACSANEDGDPAPSVTATVKFNPTNLGLGNYVYIINIADSIDYVDYDSVLFYADTTYSAVLDGTIPFTTILGPGEGRLFKIVQTSQLNLIDTINTNYTYQGKIKVRGDAIVPADSTLKIRGPAEFLAYRCPTDSSGVDSFKVEIIVSGTLEAKGTVDDSVFFISDTIPCGHPLLPDDPEPGDWYGIYFDQDADGALEYCSIRYATYGIEMENNANVVISNSNISNNEISGIYNYKGSLDLSYSTIAYNGSYGIRFMPGSNGVMKYCAVRDGIDGISLDSAEVELKHSIVKDNSDRGIYNYRGVFTADSCKIENNGYYGLYSKSAVSNIDSCHFRANENYAIYCWQTPLSGDSTIINRCLIDNTGNDVIPSGSQYGIYAGLNRMRITQCVIREYDQGGIYLSGSNAIVTNNQIRRHGNYGIYMAYSNSPYIRNCNFDSLSIGVKIRTKSYPDLGDLTSSPPDTGFSDFENCSNYYIYDMQIGVDALKAEGNYFGPGRPLPSKFYGNVDYIPWLEDDPFLKLLVDNHSPYSFELYPSFPNPFNPATNISFALDKPGHTELSIYNLMGQKVTTLMNEYLNAGQYNVVWDGRNDSGDPVSSGVYFYTIESGDRFDSKKMLLLR